MIAILTRNRIVDLGCVAILIAVALAIALPRYRIGFNWADEGFLAYGTVRVIEGQVPHRDFVSLQPPLSFYTVAAVFKTFGGSLTTLRTLGLLLYIAIALLVYGVARCLMEPWVALVAALPTTILGIPQFNFVPFAVWQGLAASFVAAALYMKGALTNRHRLGVWAGVLNAISIYLRHDQGIYVAIAFIALTIALNIAKDSPLSSPNVRNIFINWLAGLSVTLALFTSYFLLRGALPEMFRQLVVFPLTTYGKTSALPVPPLNSQHTLGLIALTALFYLPPIIILAAIVHTVSRSVRRGFDSDCAILIFLIAWSTLFYCQVITRSDPNHLLISLPPLFILLAFEWRYFVRAISSGKKGQTAATGTAIALGVIYLWTIHSLVMTNPSDDLEMLALPRGGVRMPNGQWLTTFIQGVKDYVPADRAILALPYQPMFYFLCERRNPTRWNYLWPGDQTAADHATLIAEAQKDPPAVVFLTDEAELAKSAPTIVEYVHKEFNHSADFDTLSVYFPRGATR